MSGTAKADKAGTLRVSDIVVVSANLEETHDPADIAKSDDMQSFARRVKEIVPRPPDFVLLQEVVSSAANAVAKYLKEATGVTYVVAVPPGERSPRTADSTADYVRDTAILLNTKTTTPKGAKGHFTTRYDTKDKGTRPPLVRVKEHARLLAAHLPSKTRLALMSVHFAPGAFLASQERFFKYSESWAGEICADLKKNCPRRGRQINILAGDFNNRRTMDKKETVKGAVTPMWARLQKEGYKDAVFEVHSNSDKALQNQYEKGGLKARRIDYIFVNGGEIVDASFDLSAPTYSDHRLLWAVVRPPDKKKRTTK